MVPELCWSMFGMKLVRYCLYMWLPMYLNQNVRIASFFILFGKIKIWLYVLINLILNLIIHILYMKLDFSLSTFRNVFIQNSLLSASQRGYLAFLVTHKEPMES